jgi:ABC-2 type transport system permease protein
MKKYITIFKVSIQSLFVYRINFFVGLISIWIVIFVHSQLWKFIFNSSGETVLNNYTLTEMITYVIIARLLSRISEGFSFGPSVSTEIKDGKISNMLIKPVNHFLYKIAYSFGDFAIQLGIISVSLIIALSLNLIAWSSLPNIFQLLLVLSGLIIGIIISTALDYLMALTAFWMEHIDVFFVAKKLIFSFLIGVWIPITFFPKLIQDVLNFLPFKYIIFFPIQMLQQKVSADEIIIGFIVQIFWILILLTAMKVVWSRGIKKYTSVGG